jgi:cytosine/adenosine deaminase-related metal-dependent hydrolase
VKTPNFTQADVLIEDGRVVEVGRGLRARDAEHVDATNTIVMPGFVDTHRHVWKSLFRNLGESAGEAPALGQHYHADDVYAATLIGLLGAVEAGITTVVDWSDISIEDGRTEAALEAHADAGLRTVFAHPVSNWADMREESGSPLTTIAFGSGEPLRNDLDQIARDWAQARDLGLRIHAHAGSDQSQQGVLADLAGSLAEDVTLVHGTNLGDRDLDAIASSEAAMSLTPSSEMASGFGAPPIQQLIDRGIRPGLGVDNELVAPGDLFAQMRAAISIQHATLFDLKLAGKAGVPKLLTTRDVIRYATSDGARVAGLGDVTGSLEPGKQADIVILRTDRPNISPVNDPIGAVVWGMDTSNVDWVFAGGRALVRNGVLEADVARARELATTAQHRVAIAAGLVAGAAPGGRE